MGSKKNDELNERRRKRLRAQSGIVEEGAAKPSSNIGEYSEEYVKTIIPVRDFEAKHNYKQPMWDLIKEHFKGEPKVVVEIGSRRGHWATGLMEHTKETQLFCVDPWAGRAGLGNLAVWLKRVPEVYKRAHPLVGTSLNWSRHFQFKVDLLFIDGLHDAKSVTLDLDRWTPRMNPGGLIIGNDYNQDDVKAAVVEFYPEITGKQKLGPQHAMSFWKAV